MLLMYVKFSDCFDERREERVRERTEAALFRLAQVVTVDRQLVPHRRALCRRRTPASVTDGSRFESMREPAPWWREDDDGGGDRGGGKREEGEEGKEGVKDTTRHVGRWVEGLNERLGWVEGGKEMRIWGRGGGGGGKAGLRVLGEAVEEGRAGEGRCTVGREE